MKNKLNDIINDLEIVMEAIKQGDEKDAIKMLLDIQEDLEIISLNP